MAGEVVFSFMNTTDTFYMRRCLQLAAHALGSARPNPMVGCVIVKYGEIISEGYHQFHGGYHAERNAILRCPDRSQIEGSTIYVNLEPCSHHGLTPPCADLIVECHPNRVVVCNDDPNPLVAGKGYEKLRQAGIQVDTHILENEGRFLNRRFFTFMEQKRPYVILKWAQTADGFMDIDRSTDPNGSYWITNHLLKQLSHQWRTQEAAIMVGSQTFLNDHPQLTARLWNGPQPQRFVLDRRLRTKSILPDGFTLLHQHSVSDVLCHLFELKIQSVIVEGGRQILDAFLNEGLWDEIRLLQGTAIFHRGTPAPTLTPFPDRSDTFDGNTVNYYYRSYTPYHI